MPHASDKLRETIIKRFGSLDAEGPENFLVDADYSRINGSWQLHHDLGKMTRDEFECLLFLMHEYDNGMEFHFVIEGKANDPIG